MISLTCPCGAELEVADKHAGRTMKCPKCKAPLAIPSNADDDLVLPRIHGPSLEPAKPPRDMSVRYPFCYFLQFFLVMQAAISGFASIILIALPFIQSMNFEQAIFCFTAAPVCLVSAVGSMATRELLGGAVSFLVMQKCGTQIKAENR